MEDLISQAAKELRQKQTEAEKLLWSRLKNQHLMGVKFRRQEPIGSFIVDFINYENRLIIEIDGNPHNAVENKQNDVQRTMWLERQGFRVLRFWNGEVEHHFERVVTRIRKALDISPHPDPLP
jgi:5-methyltetrahydrofolate--homocysteine methyltransferase